MMRRPPPFLPAAALLLATLLAACGKSAPSVPSGEPARPVRVSPVGAEALGDAVHAVGVLTPKNEARLSFKVGGVIDVLRAEEGARVHAGQALAILKQAEIGAAVEQARQGAAKAARDLARVRALQADGVATLEQLEDATTAAAVSAAALQAAQFNARYTRILAPTDGVVLWKLAEVGELVQAGQPVVVVGGADRGWIVRIALADRDVVRVHAGDAARVSFDAWPARVFKGKVANVSSSADPGTGTFTVEVAVTPDGAAFVQGLVAKVTLSPSTGVATAVIPVQALIEASGSEASVFVLGADRRTVRRLAIRIGRMSGAEVEVLDGLSPGALVVVDGGAFLEDGQAVRIATAAGVAAPRART
jgi:membrane fusion protein, multidrug efflux system